MKIIDKLLFTFNIFSQSTELHGKVYENDVNFLLKKFKLLNVVVRRSFVPVFMNGGPLINLTLEAYLKVNIKLKILKLQKLHEKLLVFSLFF